MRGGWPNFPLSVAILAALVCLGSSRVPQSGNHITEQAGRSTIVVDGREARASLSGGPAHIKIQSPGSHISMEVTLESMSEARFSDLPSGDYVVQVTENNYESGEIKFELRAAQTVRLSVRVTATPIPTIALALDGSWSSASGGQPATNEKNQSTCDFDELMLRTSMQVQKLVENVNKISAIEVLEHERLNKHGKVVEREKHRFNYVALVAETSPGELNVDEYRDGGVGANGGFPHDIATVGMPSLAMIFHPYHIGEFEMTCDGRAVWHDQPVWQMSFQQRKDKPARISTFRMGGKLFPVLLKGRAWIDAKNYQIIHLETDLLEAIPQIKLNVEHQALDYGPVQFANSEIKMWLPQQCEIFVDSGGRQFHHRHQYSQYRIFSVDIGQKIGRPKDSVAPE
jgi:hypothetical protein